MLFDIQLRLITISVGIDTALLSLLLSIVVMIISCSGPGYVGAAALNCLLAALQKSMGLLASRTACTAVRNAAGAVSHVQKLAT